MYAPPRRNALRVSPLLGEICLVACLRIQSTDGDKAQSTEARYTAREQNGARELGDRGVAQGAP